MNTHTNISQVIVIGAGTMGSGIAQVCALAGYNTRLFDIEHTALKRAEIQINLSLKKWLEKGKIDEAGILLTTEKLNYSTDIYECTGQLIIEAIVEKTDIKIDLFKRLAELNPENTILASNTSSLSVTRLAAGIPVPRRFIGLHFFNPATLMKLVEVVSTAYTSCTVIELAVDFIHKLGKIPVKTQDSPGFIVNRVARHYYVEALRMAEEGHISITQIDRAMEAQGFKMGPFQLMDFIGIDINHAVTQSLYEAYFYDPKFRPSILQQKKVEAGHLGKKTGKGFYEHTETT